MINLIIIYIHCITHANVDPTPTRNRPVQRAKELGFSIEENTTLSHIRCTSCLTSSNDIPRYSAGNNFRVSYHTA